MAFASKCAIVVVTIIALALTHGGGSGGVVEARRNQGNSQRKTSSSSSNSGHVTPPSSNTNNGGSSNSHADVAKLSYPNYNSQPNRPPVSGQSNGNAPPVGWNVPQGPPPAYSASNPVGGARPNVHEPPPSYHAPSYGAAPGSNVHQPITAQNHGQQNAGVPPGATYYPAGGNVPGGYQSGGYQSGGYQSGGYHPGGYQQPPGLPAGATYYPSAGHMPSAGYHPAAPPPGATYYQAGAALPPGATYYAQPPQQSSSGLGFGTGLLAGGLGGALLGHALTPSGGGSSSQPVAAAPAAGGGQDRIIIINNGVPMNASDASVAQAAAVNGTHMEAAAQPAQLAPMAPVPANVTDPSAAAGAQPPPPPGGIICVPTKVNETDPADNSKMIEVEKIACYPAPPPQAAPPGSEPVPLAPMANSTPPPAMLPPDQAAVRSNTSGTTSSSYGHNPMTLFAGLLSIWLMRFAAN